MYSFLWPVLIEKEERLLSHFSYKLSLRVWAECCWPLACWHVAPVQSWSRVCPFWRSCTQPSDLSGEELTMRWLCIHCALTLRWPCVDCAFTARWPRVDHALTVHKICVDLALTMRWLCLESNRLYIFNRINQVGVPYFSRESTCVDCALTWRSHGGPTAVHAHNYTRLMFCGNNIYS